MTAQNAAKLVCFGEMLVRLTAPAGEALLQTPQLSAHIGGAEANVAICVSRLGIPSAMATVERVPSPSRRLRYRVSGVDCSDMVISNPVFPLS